ncbi:hypothetical protein PBPRA1996 [Photobacterium profundum SS9]|uniref:Uncharacterized protein n=1 Tax=Photobacterium profundum (strain SS9) TaxID=298386 RepID=Q6LQM7_PHOPR|nr:hypothetical protein PBPRA1996 [Photobacterium profundum SS9]
MHYLYLAEVFQVKRDRRRGCIKVFYRCSCNRLCLCLEEGINENFSIYPSYLKMLVSARICWALGKALIYRPSRSTLEISNTA